MRARLCKVLREENYGPNKPESRGGSLVDPEQLQWWVHRLPTGFADRIAAAVTVTVYEGQVVANYNPRREETR